MLSTESLRDKEENPLLPRKEPSGVSKGILLNYKKIKKLK